METTKQQEPRVYFWGWRVTPNTNLFSAEIVALSKTGGPHFRINVTDESNNRLHWVILGCHLIMQDEVKLQEMSDIFYG